MRLFFMTVFFSLLSVHAIACSCIAPSIEGGRKSFKEADVVINGTIIEKSGGWQSMRPIVKIQIHEIFKGNNIPDIITADYNPSTAACGNELKVNTTYDLALYDTRSIMVTDGNNRGYGFRVMISCHQDQVRYYLRNKDKKIIETEESK